MNSLRTPPVAAYPILLTMIGASSCAGAYVAFKQAQPEALLVKKSNPFPYLAVQQHSTIKLVNPNLRFEQRYFDSL